MFSSLSLSDYDVLSLKFPESYLEHSGDLADRDWYETGTGRTGGGMLNITECDVCRGRTMPSPDGRIWENLSDRPGEMGWPGRKIPDFCLAIPPDGFSATGSCTARIQQDPRRGQGRGLILYFLAASVYG